MRAAWSVPLIAAIVLVLDATSKSWALAHLSSGQTQPFIPGLLHLTLTSNTGGAFSIGHEHRLLMTILPLLICLGIISWLVVRERRQNRLDTIEQIAFALILGGALGNLCDRFVRGRVTDFLDFAFISFPIFNVADALIDVGVGLLLLHSLMDGASGSRKINSSGENHG